MREISIFPGYRCNLLCDYCFVYKNVKCNYMYKKLDMKLIKDNILRGMQYPDTIIEILGGEPFCLKKEISLIMKEAYSIGYNRPIIIYTNGTLITDENIKYTNNLDAVLYFSIDGCKPAHNISRRTKQLKGSFDLAWDGYNYAKDKLKYEPIIQMTVTNKNIRWFEDSIKFFYENGVKKINLGWDLSRENYDFLEEQWRKIVTDNDIMEKMIIYPYMGKQAKMFYVAKGEKTKFFTTNYYLVSLEEAETKYYKEFGEEEIFGMKHGIKLRELYFNAGYKPKKLLDDNFMKYIQKETGNNGL